jgi:regulation of enolase protein 1 (concanavalin A-like superfamily)
LVEQNFGPTSVVDTNLDTININSNLVDKSLNSVTPGHVSHVDVHTLIPSRPDLRWFANGTCWWGEGPTHHVDNGTTNTTAAYAAAMVSDMESRGFNGIIFSWYGKGDQTDTVAKNVQAYLASAANTNKNFTFTIMVVFGYFSGGETVANLESNIDYCQTQYFSDANYEKENGHPLLMFFNVSPAYFSNTQMATMKAATSSNTYWVQEGVGEIGQSWVNMTYFWTDDYDQGNTNELSGSTPYNLSAVTNQYSIVKSNSGKQSYGAMCAHFNGTLTKSVGWSLGKYLPSGNGLCEYYRAKEINQVIPTNMTRMQWATWSDYEEGTEVEVGTENYFALTTSMTSSNVLSWTITAGDERTVDHYEVYAVTNGGNAADLGSVASGTHQASITQLVPGNYQLFVDAVALPCIRDHLSTGVAYTREAPNLPAFWDNQDIGSVGVGGSTSYNDGTFTVSGSGVDIWGTSDGFQYVYQPWTGDGQIVARVVSMQDTASAAKAGLMFRETLDPGSAEGDLFVTPTSGVSMQGRTVANATTSNVNTMTGVVAPCWLKLVRVGNVLSGYESADAVHWTLIGTNVYTMTNSIYVGLCVTSKTNTVLNTAVFDHVAVDGAWLNQDIGSVGLPGSSQINYSNGVVAVSGSGADIWAASDEFQYLYQTGSGDSAIIARVTGVQATSPWAKAAVMIRETMATNSRNTILFLSPSNGVQLQGRTATGGSTVSIANITNLVAPQWIQLVRSSQNMNAYLSPDGINWSWIGTQTNPMATSYDIGLAVTSKTNASINTSTFDNVTVQNAWMNGDIGSVGIPGDAGIDNSNGTNSVFTVSGSGTDIWSTSDAFQFVGQPLYGNGQIVARVLSVGNTNPWAKAGVMIRDTDAANAINALLFVSPASTNGISFQGRSSTGGTTSTFLSVSGLSAPYWLKLSRSGSTLTAYSSSNGSSWTQVGSAQTITMSTNAWVGLAVCSKNNSALNTSTFDNVTITPAP